MAAIQGNTVWNKRGSSWDFSSRDDAWQAYGLICDYEAYEEELIAQGVVKIDYSVRAETRPKEHNPYPIRDAEGFKVEQNPNDGYGGFGRTAQND
jgi:hypothetical protein